MFCINIVHLVVQVEVVHQSLNIKVRKGYFMAKKSTVDLMVTDRSMASNGYLYTPNLHTNKQE